MFAAAEEEEATVIAAASVAKLNNSNQRRATQTQHRSQLQGSSRDAEQRNAHETARHDVQRNHFPRTLDLPLVAAYSHDVTRASPRISQELPLTTAYPCFPGGPEGEMIRMPSYFPDSRDRLALESFRQELERTNLQVLQLQRNASLESRFTSLLARSLQHIPSPPRQLDVESLSRAVAFSNISAPLISPDLATGISLARLEIMQRNLLANDANLRCLQVQNLMAIIHPSQQAAWNFGSLEQEIREWASRNLAFAPNQQSTAPAVNPDDDMGRANPPQNEAARGEEKCKPANNPPHQSRVLVLALADDRGKLNDQQIFLRHQIEVFRATETDILSHTRAKNKPIVQKQVGIRCRHCSHLSAGRRRKASTYFPSALMGIYQAAHNLSVEHLQSGMCPALPPDVRKQLVTLGEKKSGASLAGKLYWADAAMRLGLVDTEAGIRFEEDA